MKHGGGAKGYRIIRAVERAWIEPPKHFAGYSKMLVTPDDVATQHFDFRVASYQPKGIAEEHVHQVSEHVYYILKGEGLMVLDGDEIVVEARTAIFIPPGVRHTLMNTGFEDLELIVATSPPNELPRHEG